MRMVNRHSPDKIMNNKTKTGIGIRDAAILVFANAYIKNPWCIYYCSYVNKL